MSNSLNISFFLGSCLQKNVLSNKSMDIIESLIEA